MLYIRLWSWMTLALPLSSDGPSLVGEANMWTDPCIIMWGVQNWSSLLKRLGTQSRGGNRSREGGGRGWSGGRTSKGFLGEPITKFTPRWDVSQLILLILSSLLLAIFPTLVNWTQRPHPGFLPTPGSSQSPFLISLHLPQLKMLERPRAQSMDLFLFHHINMHAWWSQPASWLRIQYIYWWLPNLHLQPWSCLWIQACISNCPPDIAAWTSEGISI